MRSLLLLTSLVACDGPQAYTSEGVVVHAPTFDGRIIKALDSVGGASVSFAGLEKLKAHKGAVCADRASTISGIPDDIKVVDAFADAAIWQLAQTSDEAGFASALREKGCEVLLLHHRVAPSVDEGGTVASRVYHHGQLGLFSLFRVSEELLYYSILEKPRGFPPQLAAASISYLRARLKGQPPAAFPDIKSDTGRWTLIATVRGQGRSLATALARNKSYQGALEELVEDLERKHRRNSENLGFPPINTQIDDLSVELSRVVERAYIEDRGEDFLQSYWEMGIDGAYMMGTDAKERGVLPGAASFTRSQRSADGFLRAVAKEGRMSERRPWRAEDSWLESLRSVDYRQADADSPLAYLYRGVPAIPTERVTLEAARQSVVDAGDWYLNNLAPNGEVVYKFWPSENRYSDEYNLVRHTLATWNLVMAWKMDPTREDFLRGAGLALDFTQGYLVREDWPDGDGKMAYYSFNNNQKLGTVVVNLLGMIDLARATGDHQWDEQLKEMGRFVLFMQDDNGTFEGYYVEEDHPYYGQRNDIVPGEAALSLVYLAEYFDDDSWIAGLRAYWSYYDDGGWFRERVAKANPEAPWPAYTYDNQTRLDLVQFGPWTVMAANAYHRRTGDQKVADFGLEIARWMIDTYEWDQERAPFPDYVGGYYKMPDELPAMQAFCYAEGTAAAYGLALRARPEQAAFFGERTRETVRFGLQMQYDDDSTYAFSRPEQVAGGIRYAMNETKVRIDYVHHALSAIYQWHEAAAADPNLAAEVRDGPALPGQIRRQQARSAALEAGEDPRRYPPFLMPLKLLKPPGPQEK